MAPRSNPRRNRKSNANAAIEKLTDIWRKTNFPEIQGKSGSMIVDVARRNRIRMPFIVRTRFCRNCRVSLNSGNSRTRIRKRKLSVTCIGCDRTHRYL